MLVLNHILVEILEALGIRSDAYDLKSELPNDSYCLFENNSKYQVYYSEKGMKTNLREYDNEFEAGIHFISLLAKDPTTRK